MKIRRKSALMTLQPVRRLIIATHTAVCNASRSLGISEDVALWSIIEYGLRNEKAHRDLEALRAKGDFHHLAHVLSADIEDIDLVFPDGYRQGALETCNHYRNSTVVSGAKNGRPQDLDTKRRAGLRI